MVQRKGNSNKDICETLEDCFLALISNCQALNHSTFPIPVIRILGNSTVKTAVLSSTQARVQFGVRKYLHVFPFTMLILYLEFISSSWWDNDHKYVCHVADRCL